MVKQKVLSILIPAYNESKTIKHLIEKVKSVDIGKKVKKEIIVVDDGSSDDTSSIVKKIKGVKLVQHPRNLGKGYAVRTAIKHSTGDIIIIQDADLEYDPHEYSSLIKPILDGKTKVVYGSRFLSKEQIGRNISFVKKNKRAYNLAYLGGRVLTILANLLYNAKITDEATCYKVFDAKVLKGIPLNCTRFEFCPEVTAKIRKRGYHIIEVPISYYPRTFEEGKKINWKDGVEAVWALVKYRFVD